MLLGDRCWWGRGVPRPLVPRVAAPTETLVPIMATIGKAPPSTPPPTEGIGLAETGLIR